MIEVKEAVKIAMNYFKEIVPDKYDYLRLEEVELSDDNKYWFITLGYNAMEDLFASGMMIPTSQSERLYKSLR